MQRRLNIWLSIFFLVSIMNTLTPVAPFTITNRVSAQSPVPYKVGNCTYIGKPVYPLKIQESQIPLGSNWTYIYTLNNNSTYHVYCYGDWIDYNPDSPKTDYDIFVYNPHGELESYHTEAAGLPEHLGTTVDAPFFTPKHTGNYSFLIKNDARESHGSKAATFMLIEHVHANEWYQCYMEGKVDDKPTGNTSWAYEFNATSRHVEVIIEVPDTLDMYEARLYMMANPSEGMGTFQNNMPLAWEPGLYGDLSGLYGGYNLVSEGFRHTEAMASCEFPGENMLINYTTPREGNTLYHLVLIAEHGIGSLNFMVKTDFEAPSLMIQNLHEPVHPHIETTITVNVEDHSRLDAILLNYTTNDWVTSTGIEMIAIQNQTYIGTIPGQQAGTILNYRILASDASGNKAEAEGIYFVKNPTLIELDLLESLIFYGENLTVTGAISHGGSIVELNYTNTDSITTRFVSSNSSGFFTDNFLPSTIGSWAVIAGWTGNETCFEASSSYKNFTVEKTPMLVTCNIAKERIIIGESMMIIGSVDPIVDNITVISTFTMPNGSLVEEFVSTNRNGSFTVNFVPRSTGLWHVLTRIEADNLRCEAMSQSIAFHVDETWINQHQIHIMSTIAIAVAVLVIVFLIRRRSYG